MYRLFQYRRTTIVRDRLKLFRLYRPLAALFLTRHVTASSRGAPALRQRIENAWSELGAYRKRKTGLKRAWCALFERDGPTTAEIEFGGAFPLDEIRRIACRFPQHASQELLNLVRWADRSEHEESGSQWLTGAEFELFEYIMSEHERLSRRFG
jgi:hypothetical protein